MQLGLRLTELDDGSFLDGLRWALRQSWVDERTQSVLRSALAALAVAEAVAREAAEESPLPPADTGPGPEN